MVERASQRVKQKLHLTKAKATLCGMKKISFIRKMGTFESIFFSSLTIAMGEKYSTGVEPEKSSSE